MAIELKANGLTHEFLAVHYRDGDLNDKRQGHYKGFQTRLEADNWLQWRCSKSADSPKGRLVLPDMKQLRAVLGSTPYVSLRGALQAYLNFINDAVP